MAESSLVSQKNRPLCHGINLTNINIVSQYGDWLRHSLSKQFVLIQSRHRSCGNVSNYVTTQLHLQPQQMRSMHKCLIWHHSWTETVKITRILHTSWKGTKLVNLSLPLSEGHFTQQHTITQKATFFNYCLISISIRHWIQVVNLVRLLFRLQAINIWMTFIMLPNLNFI